MTKKNAKRGDSGSVREILFERISLREGNFNPLLKEEELKGTLTGLRRGIFLLLRKMKVLLFMEKKMVGWHRKKSRKETGV